MPIDVRMAGRRLATCTLLPPPAASPVPPGSPTGAIFDAPPERARDLT